MDKRRNNVKDDVSDAVNSVMLEKGNLGWDIWCLL